VLHVDGAAQTAHVLVRVSPLDSVPALHQPLLISA
jgi:hypothetical protein